ncbi:MAG: phenylalanine--tRNA ligase subunit beta [Flavobacteriales bacterium]
MRISWNWLKTLTDADLTPQVAADVLTSTGLEVESVELLEPIKGMLTGVVVGHVVKRDKHPDADRLSVCSVDLGNGVPVGIVCGASNVAEGQKVLVALVGSTLHMADGNSIVIKKSRIRGVESNGMICAEDELGLGQSHDGIMVLDPTAIVGTSAAEYLKLTSDLVLEIGLTPNRADAMSLIGVARDLVAALNVRTGSAHKVLWPSVEAFKQDDDARAIPVEVGTSEVCPRYAGVTLTNVKVGLSPTWLQERLKSIGLKPINNVVDVTNYVQHELGQPLHAFDADQLKGGRIVVRLATEGEPFTTLDGKERKLSANDLVIADTERPACIAGVFGGAGSGVSDATSTVFLESACFDPASIRRTARRHGLNTDASFRFERGVDPENTILALERAALLLKEVSGARISSAVTDTRLSQHPWKRVKLFFAQVDVLIGVPIAQADVLNVLTALDCRIVHQDTEAVEVDVPPYRVDVTRPVDLVEEIVRLLGFDRVPIPEHLMMPALQRPEVTLDGMQRQLALHLSARGFREVMTPSLVNGMVVSASGVATADTLVRLRNPLSAELGVLRPTMLFGLLQCAAYNSARQQRDLRLFEKGRVYGIAGGGTLEQERTGLLLTGQRWRENWRAGDRNVDQADVAEEVELLLNRFGIGNTEPRPVEHPLMGSAIEIRSKQAVLAVIGAVAPTMLKAFDLSQPAYYAELHDAAWLAALQAQRIAYTEVSKFPSVRRDLSLLLDKSVSFAQLEKLARQSERKLLRAVDLFDVYEGEKLPAGKKSYALSFILQDDGKTLTDEQVEKAMGRIRQAFEKEAGAELRG